MLEIPHGDHVTVCSLEDYVLRRSKGKPVPITADVLRVEHWHDVNWGQVHTTALHFITRLLRVKHLAFIDKDHMSSGATLERYLKLLATYGKEGNHPFPDLREISMVFVVEGNPNAPYWNPLLCSRVNKLTWDMRDVPFWADPDQDRNAEDNEVTLVETSRLVNNFWGTGIIMCCPHLREIKFCLPWIDGPVPYERGGVFVINDHGENLIKALENNRRRLKEAQDSIIALLALRKRRDYSEYRDVLVLITKEIWTKSFPKELTSFIRKA